MLPFAVNGTQVMSAHASFARSVKIAHAKPMAAKAHEMEKVVARPGAKRGASSRSTSAIHHAPQPRLAKVIESIQVRWRRRTTRRILPVVLLPGRGTRGILSSAAHELGRTRAAVERSADCAFDGAAAAAHNRRPSVGAWRSLASALQWGGRGRRFESARPDQFFECCARVGADACGG